METPSKPSTPPECFRPEHGITRSALPSSISSKPTGPSCPSFVRAPAGTNRSPSSPMAGLLTRMRRGPRSRRVSPSRANLLQIWFTCWCGEIPVRSRISRSVSPFADDRISANTRSTFVIDPMIHYIDTDCHDAYAAPLHVPGVRAPERRTSTSFDSTPGSPCPTLATRNRTRPPSFGTARRCGSSCFPPFSFFSFALLWMVGISEPRRDGNRHLAGAVFRTSDWTQNGLPKRPQRCWVCRARRTRAVSPGCLASQASPESSALAGARPSPAPPRPPDPLLQRSPSRRRAHVPPRGARLTARHFLRDARSTFTLCWMQQSYSVFLPSERLPLKIPP